MNHIYGNKFGNVDDCLYFCRIIISYATNQLDRLGEGTGSDNCRVLPFTLITGVVLLSLSASLHYYHFLLSVGLSEKRPRK